MNKSIKIAVLGAGNIGSTLGEKWMTEGYPVVYGVRDATSVKSQSALAKGGSGVRFETIVNAIQWGDVLVIAIPNSAVNEMLARHGALLNDKIVIDTTNRFGEPVVNHLAEISAAAPRAIVHRAFNSLGWENFAQPRIEGEQVDLFYCGPHGKSQEVVEELIAAIGLRPIRVGGLETAALVDAIGSLWVILAIGQHRGRHISFRLLGG